MTAEIRRRLAALFRHPAEAGTSAIELALIFPVLLLVFLGIFEFGRAMWSQSLIDYAVQAAARCATNNTSLCSSNSATASYAAGLTAPLNLPNSVFTASSSGCGNLVTASYAFKFAVPAIFPFNLTFTSQACYPT